MKVPYIWLKDYVEKLPPPDELAHVLSIKSFPVDSVEKVDDEPVLMVDIPHNRPDCLGIIGIAREIAAITETELQLPKLKLSETLDAVKYVNVTVLDKKLCPRYTARVVFDVKIKPSPDWMQKKLTLAGLRPVNNIVDVTNYVLLETGHPLHAFDSRFLNESSIIVRRANAGEKIKAIDGKEYSLTDEMLVIADAALPVAIAGIIGGKESEIAQDTRTVVIESALFDHASIMKTSRKLGVRTESSSRFERKCDFETADFASRRAAVLMHELADAKIAGVAIDIHEKKPEPTSIKLRNVEKILGIKVEKAESYLTRLGFQKSRDGDSTFLVPHWRKDVTQDVDLVEEVARLYGYENIPSDEGLSVETVTRPKEDIVRNKIREMLTRAGCYESLTLSLVEKQTGGINLTPFGMLRSSIAPMLMSVLETNKGYKQEPRPLFEIAKVYEKSGEREVISIVHPGDFRGLKGIIEMILSELHIGFSYDFERNTLVSDTKLLGRINFEGEYPSCELDFSLVVELCSLDRKFQDFSRLPFVKRDLSIIVDEQIEWALVEAQIRGAEPNFLESYKLFDVYNGKQVPEGKKSFAFSLYFRIDRTLKSEEVDREVSKVIESLQTGLGATLRQASAEV